MGYIIDLLGRKCRNPSPLEIYSCIIAVVAVLYISFFKFEGIWHLDDLTYTLSILSTKPYPLLLGRTGFCYPLIGLWLLLKNLGIADFYSVESAILYLNIIFLTFSYVLTFRILVAVKVPLQVAFVAVLLVLSELSFSVLGSRYNDTPLMLLCVLGSYYTFILAHEKMSYRLLLVSALLYGYSILTREPAVFYGLFFLITVFWFKKRNLNFIFRQYGISLALCVLVSVSGPLLLYLFYGSNFYNSVVSSLSIYMFDDTLESKLSLLWHSHVNLVFAAAASIGIYLMYRQMKMVWLLWFFAVTLIPILVFVVVGGNELIAESRFFFSLFLLLTVPVAFLVVKIPEYFNNKVVSSVVLSSLIFGFMYFGTNRYLPEYEKSLALSRKIKTNYAQIAPVLTGKTVLILGYDSLYFLYRTRIEGINCYVISGGMNWPTGGLATVLDAVLRDDRKVYYDSTGDDFNRKKREKDLKHMVEEFEISAVDGDGLYQVEGRKKNVKKLLTKPRDESKTASQ